MCSPRLVCDRVFTGMSMAIHFCANQKVTDRGVPITTERSITSIVWNLFKKIAEMMRCEVHSRKFVTNEINLTVDESAFPLLMTQQEDSSKLFVYGISRHTERLMCFKFTVLDDVFLPCYRFVSFLVSQIAIVECVVKAS